MRTSPIINSQRLNNIDFRRFSASQMLFLRLHFSVAYLLQISFAYHKIYDLIQAPPALFISFEQLLLVGFCFLLKKFLILILRFFQFLSQLQYLLLLPLYPYPDIQRFPCHNIHLPISS